MRSCGISCGGGLAYVSLPSSSLRSAAINSGLVTYALRCSNSQAFPCVGTPAPAVAFLLLRFDRHSRKARAVMMMPARAAPTAMPATAPVERLEGWPEDAAVALAAVAVLDWVVDAAVVVV